MARGTFSTTRIELGPCDCPGNPHADGDWVEIKDRLQFGDIRRIAAVSFTAEFNAMLIARAISAWNLVDEKGEPVHIPVHDNWTDFDAVDVLSPAQSQLLYAAVNTDEYSAQLRPGPLPNPSGGPSESGSADSSPSMIPTSPTSSPTTP